MTDDFRDDRDINRQYRKLYAYLRFIVLQCILPTYGGIIECIALEN